MNSLSVVLFLTCLACLPRAATTTGARAAKPIPFQQGKGGSHSVPILLTSTAPPLSPPTVLFTAFSNSSQTLFLQQLYSPNLILRQLAASGETMPSTNNTQNFTAFTDLGGSTEQPLFLGEGNGEWGEKNKFLGLYYYSFHENRTVKIVDTTDQLPTGERFQILCCARTVPRSTTIVFAGASAYDGEGIEGIYKWDPATQRIKTLVDNTIQVLRYIDGPTKVTELGDLFFFASNPSLPFADGIYTLNVWEAFDNNVSTTVSPVVLRGQKIPHQHNSSQFVRVFTAFGSPISFYSSSSTSSNASSVLFTATGTYGVLGVYTIALQPHSRNHSNRSITVVLDNLKNTHFANFPTSPTVDNAGNVVVNVETNSESSTGLYYVMEVEGGGRNAELLQNLSNSNKGCLNIDIQFNSMEDGCLVFYTTNGTVDQLWSVNVSSTNRR